MINIKRWIGCDVGKTGALVSIDEADNVEIIPYDEIAYRDALERWSQDKCHAVVEQVSAMPGNGSVGMFHFGMTYGEILGMMIAYRIPYQTVRASSWKKLFGLNLSKDKTYADKKAADIAKCHALFPNVSLKRTERCKRDDDNIADALLLAEACRRLFA